MVDVQFSKTSVERRVGSNPTLGTIKIKNARLVKLADMHVSEACVERRIGSSPILGTKIVTTSFLQVEPQF